jgi:hypothetical protein
MEISQRGLAVAETCCLVRPLFSLRDAMASRIIRTSRQRPKRDFGPVHLEGAPPDEGAPESDDSEHARRHDNK